MNLTITDAAMVKISEVLDKVPNGRLALMYEDGVSPYSHHGLVALQVSFVVVILGPDQPVLPWFDETITSNRGPVLIKGYAKEFLSENMVIDVKHFGGLVLRGDNGVIDDTPVIRDESQTPTD